MRKNPLGKPTRYGQKYNPDLLFAVPRKDAREAMGLGEELPFSGVDLWNAWELTWLDAQGKPMVATAEIRVSAGSGNIIESKSLKLYLDSLALTRYPGADDVQRLLSADLSAVAGSEVKIDLVTASSWSGRQVTELPGVCIDDRSVSCPSTDVDSSLLEIGDGKVQLEALHSHLLRSLCPVTGQPDSGSILIRYAGPKIDASGLLRYLVSYRQHSGFHEACVENVFVDILHRCRPTRLTVYARYHRRGGLDINPFRSNFEAEPANIRLWRQ